MVGSRPKAGYRLRVLDEKGKVIAERICEDDVITDNVFAIFEGLISGNQITVDKFYSTKVTTTESVDFNEINIKQCSALAPEGDDTYGLVIGSGTGTPSPADDYLFSQIKHGTDNGQMYYGATEEYIPSTTGNQIIVGISRSFTNKTSSSVNVTEIGFVLKIGGTDGSGNSVDVKTLLMHDVFDSAVSVPANGTIAIDYYFQFNTS